MHRCFYGRPEATEHAILLWKGQKAEGLMTVDTTGAGQIFYIVQRQMQGKTCLS